jgi:hypothetical protein
MVEGVAVEEEGAAVEAEAGVVVVVEAVGVVVEAVGVALRLNQMMNSCFAFLLQRFNRLRASLRWLLRCRGREFSLGPFRILGEPDEQRVPFTRDYGSNFVLEPMIAPKGDQQSRFLLHHQIQLREQELSSVKINPTAIQVEASTHRVVGCVIRDPFCAVGVETAVVSMAWVTVSGRVPLQVRVVREKAISGAENPVDLPLASIADALDERSRVAKSMSSKETGRDLHSQVALSERCETVCRIRITLNDPDDIGTLCQAQKASRHVGSITHAHSP